MSLGSVVYRIARAPVAFQDAELGTLELATALDDDYARQLSALSGTGTVIAARDRLIALLRELSIDPGELIVRVDRSKVSIALFRVCWEGPHTPVVRPMRLAILNWRRLPASRLMMTLHGLVFTAREVRTRTYHRCERCFYRSRVQPRRVRPEC